MTIKYGSVEYFTLHRVNDFINSYDIKKLDLVTLDRLRMEVATKIAAIDLKYTEQRAGTEPHECRYSKAMDQPHPRPCVICGKPETINL